MPAVEPAAVLEPFHAGEARSVKSKAVWPPVLEPYGEDNPMTVFPVRPETLTFPCSERPTHEGRHN